MKLMEDVMIVILVVHFYVAIVFQLTHIGNTSHNDIMLILQFFLIYLFLYYEYRCTPPHKSTDYQKIYSDWCNEFEKYKSAMKSWEKKQAVSTYLHTYKYYRYMFYKLQILLNIETYTNIFNLLKFFRFC